MKPTDGRLSAPGVARIPSARRPADAPLAAPDDMVMTYLRHQRDVITTNLPGVRAKDVEAVHDMRVAVRRVRSSLRTFRPAFDRARSEWLRTELHWLADALGAVRDIDVMFARLEDAIANERPETMVGPVARRIRRRLLDAGRIAHRDLAGALTSERHRRLVAALTAFTSSRLRRIPVEELRRMAGRPVRTADVLLVAARASREEADRDVTLHRARREYKRARYAIEVLIPVDGEPARIFAARVGELQEVLGTHQDSIVTAELLRDYGMSAHAAGENAFSYGLLYRRQLDAGEHALTGLDRTVRRVRSADYLAK